MATFADWNPEVAKLAIETDKVDAVQISDDLGGTSGLLVSPEYIREFFLKPLERMVQGTKNLGAPVIMHNDGKIWICLMILWQQILMVGFHPVEKAAGMDLKIVKEQYDGKLYPVGNVNNKTTMVTGTPENVWAEVKECIEIAAPGGGYIISIDHSLHDDILNEKVFALIEAINKFENIHCKHQLCSCRISS